MKQLKPNDISVMRTAIGLYAQPFGVESFAVMLNEDKTEPKSEEERVTCDLLHRLDQYEYGLAPEFTLSEDEAKFVTDALRQLIVRDNQSLGAKKRPVRNECEKSAPRPCASRVSAEYKRSSTPAAYAPAVENAFSDNLCLTYRHGRRKFPCGNFLLLNTKTGTPCGFRAFYTTLSCAAARLPFLRQATLSTV